ncbi:MAG: hypothetical protein B6245_05750 [Desulfobacteraceae bacterium 4572_88]|nr:MAG: hypothetical protein B6245_05750 [Desulfobacteraceae bacterium 4572_88]
MPEKKRFISQSMLMPCRICHLGMAALPCKICLKSFEKYDGLLSLTGEKIPLSPPLKKGEAEVCERSLPPL